MPRSRDLSRMYVPPMMALAASDVPEGDWRLEMKFDGYRAIVAISNGSVEIWSRNGNAIGRRYPDLAKAMLSVAAKPAVLDGEIVALDARGVPSFQLLQRSARTAGRVPLYYYAFDLLRLDTHWMLDEPLETRQQALRELLKSPPAHIRLSEVFDVKPERLLAAARKHHWEGIIAKRSGSRYESARRSGTWLKCKVRFEQEFVIGGYTQPRGGRSHFGALLVGYYDDGTLNYAGKVGTGFSEAGLSALHRRLVREQRIRCPFGTPPEVSGATWVRPVLVGQVSFAEWTQDGLLRQASFLGLRDDKSAQQVRREDGVTP